MQTPRFPQLARPALIQSLMQTPRFQVALRLAIIACVALASCNHSATHNAPPATLPTPPTTHALHNLHPIGTKLISGAAPDGDAAFDELASMGVKTIITVDGATPDVQRARARGIRYVHIPITYAQVNTAQQLEIARAVRDLPGPIYLHCHHGMHRGPAAAASAAVLLGEVSPQQGVDFMKLAGTAPQYQGLYACVASATAASAQAINAAPADFPELRRADGIVASMVETDIAHDNLKAIKAAGWKVPQHHPDLVPAAEAGRLTDNLRLGHQDPICKQWGDDFEQQMLSAIRAASALEQSIVARATSTQLDSDWKLVSASCKDCHAQYRNKPTPLALPTLSTSSPSVPVR